jgi:16S rRNA A1518/A1519 N6-dimethyltransferase RsmA/KsgA/DIM1 with predicted DNA glycosylase/AP lyase activity
MTEARPGAGVSCGASTRVLARRHGRLSVVELEQRYCERLRREQGEGGQEEDIAT